MSFQSGDLILGDRYRIDKLIGAGVYSTVYRVLHMDLGVTRAVKVLRRDSPGVSKLDYADYKRRFQLEAKIAAEIDHPNVLKVHDFVEEDEALYAVLTYAPNHSLADRLDAGHLIPWMEVAHLLIDAARGLEALHNREIVHRDVKPANILIDEMGSAKVADLGQIQVSGVDLTDRSRLGSEAGPHPGTPAYRSPEHENPALLMPTSDVFSLGCVAFEMLTGEVWRWSQRKVSCVRDLEADVPGWLDAVVMRMLRETPGFSVGDADDPSKRYVDMQGVITALETGLAGGSLPSRSRFRSWVQRAFSSSTSVSPLGSVGEFAQSIQGDVRSLASAAHEALSRRGLFDQASGDSDLRILTVPIRLALIRVPAGKFLMGSDPDLDDDAGDREGPQHCVDLPEFCIGKYPITYAQYETFVQSTGYRAPTDWENDRAPAGRRDHPVVYVSWSDVRAFCAWLSRETGTPIRLPSEAEWEKAARGPDGRLYPWGDRAPTVDLCNFNANVGDTTPVGRYSPQGDSAYGCADMAGNVRERTRSLRAGYPYRPADGREAPHMEGIRLLRGGSFRDGSHQVRCASRAWDVPLGRNRDCGFRVVVSYARRDR